RVKSVVFKRLIWFSSGAVSGAAGSWYVKRRIQEKLRRFTPGGVRSQAVARAKRAQTDAKIVVAEGRRLARDYRDQNSPQQKNTGP
ncbi:MAG: hypothetical protein ACI9BK_003367, partial [Acidimicrobiales bacterium]